MRYSPAPETSIPRLAVFFALPPCFPSCLWQLKTSLWQLKTSTGAKGQAGLRQRQRATLGAIQLGLVLCTMCQRAHGRADVDAVHKRAIKQLEVS